MSDDIFRKMLEDMKGLKGPSMDQESYYFEVQEKLIRPIFAIYRFAMVQRPRDPEWHGVLIASLVIACGELVGMMQEDLQMRDKSLEVFRDALDRGQAYKPAILGNFLAGAHDGEIELNRRSSATLLKRLNRIEQLLSTISNEKDK
jgi:hypothetical protein